MDKGESMKSPLTPITTKTTKRLFGNGSHLLPQPLKGVVVVAKVTLLELKRLQLSLMAEVLRNGASVRLMIMANELHELSQRACETTSFRHGVGRANRETESRLTGRKTRSKQ